MPVASAVPNHAPRTSSGLGRDAPRRPRGATAAARRRAAPRRSSRASRAGRARGSRRRGRGRSSRPPRSSAVPGKYAKWVSATCGCSDGGGSAAVAAVEALEPRARVVVAVRRVPVAHELARELDLVRRVVDVEPRRRAVAKPDLEQRRGDGTSTTTAVQAATSTQARHDPPASRRSRRRRRAGRRARRASARRRGPSPRRRRARGARAGRGRRPAAVRNGHGSEPSDGTLIATSSAEHAEHAEGRAAVDPGAAHAGPSGRAAARAARKLRGEPEHEPGERVLEEAAVEERVHEERRGRPRRARARTPRRAGTRAGAPSPRRRAARRRARARRCRARRRPSAASCARRRATAARRSSRRAWLARGCEPRPTPTSGWCGEDPRRQVDPPRAVARDPLGRRARDLVGHERAAAGEHEHGRDGRDEPHGAVAGDDRRRRRRRRRARRGSTASTRRRGRRTGTRRQRRRRAMPSLRYHAADEQDRDPEHDVAAVQARVAEQRRDAEEARVRVPDSTDGV